MERRYHIFFILIVFILTFLGNTRGAGAQGWIRLEGQYYSIGRFVIKIPANWRMRPPIEGELFLTRDGVWLQLFRLGRVSLETAFSHTRKTLAKGMPPEEVAKVAVDDLKANRLVSKPNVLEIETTDLAGFPAFRMVYSYESNENVKKMGIYYGLLLDDWYYFFQYQAPARHYFARDLSTFGETIKSLQLAD